MLDVLCPASSPSFNDLSDRAGFVRAVVCDVGLGQSPVLPQQLFPKLGSWPREYFDHDESPNRIESLSGDGRCQPERRCPPPTIAPKPSLRCPDDETQTSTRKKVITKDAGSHRRTAKTILQRPADGATDISAIILETAAQRGRLCPGRIGVPTWLRGRTSSRR